MSRRNYKYIIGIDEAGRGPLAGPVVVAGIAHKYGKRPPFLDRLKDSKKLTPAQREKYFKLITSHPDIRWAAVKIGPAAIDKMNISRAANFGARKIFKKLSRGVYAAAVLDGGLYLSRFSPHDTVIKGDEKVPVVAAASIIAKVVRDRVMLRLHKKYPQYKFDAHKGYGTKIHREVIKKLGICEAHRHSFRHYR